MLKIIITQRETIQTQLGNLKAKDLYLKTLDKSLSCSDGREYVLRNYLEQIPEHSEVSSPLLLSGHRVLMVINIAGNPGGESG